MRKCSLLIAAFGLFVVTAQAQNTKPASAQGGEFYIDPARGNDSNAGTQARPWRTVSAAVAHLPDPVMRDVTFQLAPGRYETTGGKNMPVYTLELMRRMRPGVTVRFVGNGRADAPVIFGWEDGHALVQAVEGHWAFEGIQIGSGSMNLERMIDVAGPAHLELRDAVFRTRGTQCAGIYAHRGGKVSLYGKIRMNEHVQEKDGADTFCGIVADDHGLVKFEQREGASLDIGNGSLSASYYGCIRLGCATAKITNWSKQSNNLAINNSGRIDLHSTKLTLQAHNPKNTPIGLEHDGHILAEGAHITIEGPNDMAIALQKASTFTCNDLELHGTFEYVIWATGGSTFVGRFLSDVGQVEATTGARVSIEEIKNKHRFIGPVIATYGGQVSLPDGQVRATSE